MKYSLVLAVLALFPACLSSADAPPVEGPPRPKAVDPPKAGAIDDAIRRGVAFLLKDQNEDGSWGTAGKTKGLNIYTPVPGGHDAFRTAVTSLCISALIEVGGDSAEVRKAIQRGETWLLDNVGKLRRATPDVLYNVWGHGYAIQALARMHQRLPKDTDRQKLIEQRIREQMDYLKRYESVDGGWGYYDFRVGSQRPATDSMSFVNAAILVAFHDAKDIGIAPPAEVVQRAVDATLRQQKPDRSYLYGEYLMWRPQHLINRPGGSLGRSQACNVALRLWGDKSITDQIMTGWLDRLFAQNLWLDLGRKRPVPHESHYFVAGYFFYFGHYYAALCIDQLKPEARPFYQDHLAQVLLPLQEDDGSWWDFPLYNYHQQYGTAFALMSLKRCQKSK